MDPVLQVLLKHQGNFISGMSISEEIRLSRTAVWKHVQNLINTGYGIDCIKKKGYRLHALPVNQWIPEKLSLLCPRDLAWFYRQEVDSTNLWAKEIMVRSNQSAVFFTDNQYAGKGRLGREWQSAIAKDIPFSLTLPLNTDVCHYYQYTVIMALSVQNILHALLNESIQIKWPNDIYISGKKICGILTEMLTEENRLRTLIIGVGINVNSEDLLPHAVSMKFISGKHFDRHVVLSEILNRFFTLLDQYHQEGFSTIYATWKENLLGLHQPVRIDTGHKVIEGVLADINEQGIAIIETADTKELVYSGDLFLHKT